MLRKYLIEIVLPIAFCFVGYFLYAPLLDNPTHFDDIFHITIPAIDTLTPIAKFFIYDEDIGVNVPHRGLALLSHAITKAFSSSESLYSFYFTNIFIHVANSAILLLLVPQMLRTIEGETENFKKGKRIATVAALLFLVHPIQLNVVGYLAQRTSLLMAFFGLLSLMFFLKALENRAKREFLLLLSLFLFIAALYSKENIAAILPILFYFAHRSSGKVTEGIKLTLPFLLIVPLYLLNAHLSTHTSLIEASPLEYLLTQFVVISKYLGLLLFPSTSRLNFDWDVGIYSSLLSTPVISGFLLIGAVVGIGIYLLFWKRNPIGLCLLWFIVTLMPDSSFIPLPETMVEYRLYFPGIGFYVLIGCLLYQGACLLKLNERNQLILFGVVGLLLVSACTSITKARIPVLDSELDFWNDVIEKSPNKMRGYINRGFAWQQLGEYKKAYKDYGDAIALNNDKHDPGMAYLNRASIYFSFNMLDDAIKDYTSAIEANKEDRVAYAKRGVIYGKQGRFDDAIQDFTSAIEIGGNVASLLFQRGVAHLRKNEIALAIRDFNEANGKLPDPNIYFTRAECYQLLNRPEKARSDYETSCRLGKSEACGRAN